MRSNCAVAFIFVFIALLQMGTTQLVAQVFYEPVISCGHSVAPFVPVWKQIDMIDPYARPQTDCICNSFSHAQGTWSMLQVNPGTLPIQVVPSLVEPEAPAETQRVPSSEENETNSDPIRETKNSVLEESSIDEQDSPSDVSLPEANTEENQRIKMARKAIEDKFNLKMEKALGSGANVDQLKEEMRIEIEKIEARIRRRFGDR